MGLSIVILAAGEGSRMYSDIPKVLHPVGGTPMLAHVVNTARQLDDVRVLVVYGHGGQTVPEALSHLPVSWVEQAAQLGTGHAVQQTLGYLEADDTVLVLYGDVPLIRAETLQRLLEQVDETTLALLTVHLEEPAGYGRIIRDEAAQVIAIVEDRDASVAERGIAEVNTGILAVKEGILKHCLDALENNNAQREYYLTDIIARCVAEGLRIMTTSPDSPVEVMGVNNRQQLAQVERHFQQRQAACLMQAGVNLQDPTRFDLRGGLHAGRDVTIDINVIISGEVKLGDRVSIGPNVVIHNSIIGDDTSILANCVIEDAVVGENCQIGPFARLRPETELQKNARVGNFVEIKKSSIGRGSKINHLSYIGDTTVGCDVNIGAGTITCNYDGANKHRTEIGDRAFIGSDSQLVAPVKIGAGATIGAGSTITRDAPADELTLSRAQQQTRTGWTRPVKKLKKES